MKEGKEMTIEHSEQIYLEDLQNKQQTVQIYLGSGIKLVGHIVGFDDFTILLSGKGHGSQMLYKHAITSMSLAHPQEER